MPTIINNPPSQGETDSGMGLGLLLGIIIAVLIGLAIIFFYGWPMLKGNQPPQDTTNINVQLPTPTQNEPAK